jgi:hypothetical protein
MGSDGSVRVLLFKAAHDGCVGVTDSVTLWVFFRRDTPTIDTDKANLFLWLLLSFRVLTTSRHDKKFSGERDDFFDARNHRMQKLAVLKKKLGLNMMSRIQG